MELIRCRAFNSLQKTTLRKLFGGLNPNYGPTLTPAIKTFLAPLALTEQTPPPSTSSIQNHRLESKEKKQRHLGASSDGSNSERKKRQTTRISRQERQQATPNNTQRQACIHTNEPTFYAPNETDISRSPYVMSEPEEQPKLDLDLGTAFLPSWAQKPAKENPYAKYEGRDNDRSGRRDSRRSDRFDRSRNQRPGDRRRPGGGGDRDNSQRRQNRPQEAKPRPPQGGGDGQNRRPARQGGQGGQDRARQQRPRHRSRQEIIASLPGLKVNIIPDQKGVESLAKQIRMQGRAYPLFDIATLVLKRPDRFRVTTSLQSDAKGIPVSEQWRCLLDDSLWLSQGEAIDHVLNEHFDQFYERLKTETEPPKGNHTFVAQCGISGKILGPPNYHGYQDALRTLHAERFARMNFDAFKDRVRIVREEEVVKKWIEEQSWKTEFKSKAQPEAEAIGSWEALIEDFKSNHLKDTIETGKSLTISAAAGLKTPSKPLQELIRFHVEDQRRFPLQVATMLSQMFARQGLQFFKVNRTITHVSVARPKYLDMNETPVSTGVQKIVEFIDETPDCNRKKLFDALKPAGAASPTADGKQEETPVAKATEDAPAATANAGAEIPEKAAADKTETSKEEQPAQAAPTAPRQVSPEETAIITDLHWLIHQGHVIEFSNGKMETAKKPAPRPEKAEKKSTPEKPTPSAVSPEAKPSPSSEKSKEPEQKASPSSDEATPEAKAPEAPKAEIAAAPQEAETSVSPAPVEEPKGDSGTKTPEAPSTPEKSADAITNASPEQSPPSQES